MMTENGSHYKTAPQDKTLVARAHSTEKAKGATFPPQKRKKSETRKKTHACDLFYIGKGEMVAGSRRSFGM